MGGRHGKTSLIQGWFPGVLWVFHYFLKWSLFASNCTKSRLVWIRKSLLRNNFKKIRFVPPSLSDAISRCVLQSVVFGNSHRHWPGLTSFFVRLGVKSTKHRREIKTGFLPTVSIRRIILKLSSIQILNTLKFQNQVNINLKSLFQKLFPICLCFTQENTHRHSKKTFSFIWN